MDLVAPKVSWNPLAAGYSEDPWPQYAELVLLCTVRRQVIGRFFYTSTSAMSYPG